MPGALATGAHGAVDVNTLILSREEFVPMPRLTSTKLADNRAFLTEMAHSPASQQIPWVSDESEDCSSVYVMDQVRDPHGKLSILSQKRCQIFLFAR